MMRPGLIAVVVLVFACHGAPSPISPTAPSVTGRVAIAPGASVATTKGLLFVTWLTADEQGAVATGTLTMRLIRDMITRGVVVGEIDAGHEVSFIVHPDRGRVVLAATVDVNHVGVAAILGDGDGTLQGTSAPFDVAGAAVQAPPIALTSHPHSKEQELCQGAQLTLEHVAAPEVAGTVGNDTSRRACVRVPNGYTEHPERRYPVVYALPGLLGTDAGVVRQNFEPDDMIVVAVDTTTKTGSTYLVDSATSGQWDSFFTKNLIPFIDAHYRTLPRREARAIMGHSTGGFNAVSYGLRHPELIGVIGGSSPDVLDLAVWLGGGSPRRWIRDWQRVERSLGGGGQVISYAADWSPTASGYDWPFDSSGAIVEGVMQRWFANNPSTWLRDPKRVAALLPFSGKIYLTVGDTDEFDLHAPTVKFSQQLTAAGIANELVVTHGGHVTHAREQLAAIVQFCKSKLEAAI